MHQLKEYSKVWVVFGGVGGDLGVQKLREGKREQREGPP